MAADGSATGLLQFVSVDGLTVTGNAQPLTTGVLVSATNCTNAVLNPNP